MKPMTDREMFLIEAALRWDGGPPAKGLWEAVCAVRMERGLPQEERWPWVGKTDGCPPTVRANPVPPTGQVVGSTPRAYWR